MSADVHLTDGRRQLVIEDTDGERLEVDVTHPTDHFRVMLEVVAGSVVGLTHEDGLALLSFLADALGVERAEPDPATYVSRAEYDQAVNLLRRQLAPFEVCTGCGGDLRTAPVVESGVEWCHAPMRRPGGAE